MKKKNAFTLVELLIVIAIIAVLAALLMPAIGGSRRNTDRAAAKSFMAQLAGAIDQYKSDRGYYPEFLTEKERVNLAEGNNAENLVKALTGKNPDGTKLSDADRKKFSPKGRNYFTFEESNLKRKDNSWKIVDTFGNPNIYICVGKNGFVKNGYPKIADGLSQSEFSEIVPDVASGIRKSVIVFTLKKDEKNEGADYEAENIFSWK